ncbi:hypothetical protein [Spiroplasma endosymbiont of Panorpa germanica]|uniref:hypothetical protein n=1 Tax=Spiroplasma endosymbiont of Panorpa germanica TaxID=3066314 RepID=UPI0030D0DEE5
MKTNFETNNIFLKNLNSNNPYLESMKNINVDVMLSEIYAKTRVDKERLLENILNKKNPSNWDREVQEQLFEMYYEKCAQKIYGVGYNDLIEDDWVYGSKKQFSVVESQNYYKNNILYKQILPMENQDDEIEYLTSAGNFKTSWKNWRDNFFYLKNEINNPDLNLEKMYYLSNDNDNDLNNFSDLKGDNLGNTMQEARKKQSNREEKHIRTRLFIYNIDGELVTSDDDEENAYFELRKKINLESKFISDREAANIRNLETQWNELISDGIYNVYRFKTKDNIYLYFSSFSNAFSYYEKQYSITSNISQRDELVYRYSFKMNNKEYEYFWKNKSEIKEIAVEINQLRKLN